MTHPFEIQLEHIRETISQMAKLVQENFEQAMKALVERDDALAAQVEADDSKIDRLEIEIDDIVVTYMATHAPMATDCRLMLAASKIASNLESIGDQCTTIVRRARELSKEALLKPLIDIPEMAAIARSMLGDSITAFLSKDADAAKMIIPQDREVDGINKQLHRELTSYMIENPATVTRALNLMTVAKSLERIADYAKHIAEDVYFLYRGADIRHQNKREAL